MSISRGQRLAHYELVEELAQGGMGVIWRARDTRLNREIAIKFLPEQLQENHELLARFEREARAVAALSHPNIVTIHSVEKAHGRRFLTLELVHGKTLAALIPEGGMPLERLLEIALPLVEAIGAAHERGIIHRDLKPANVMVSDAGVLKILDFGLAKFHEPEPAPKEAEPGQPEPEAQRPEPEAILTISTTHEDRISGTISYMSPEQVRGRPVDHRSDLFSLGVILYEMAAGRRPFHGETAVDVMAAILRDTPAPLTGLRPDLQPALERTILRCLEKDPRRRVQSALDLRHDLEAVRTGFGVGLRAGDLATGRSIAVLPFADLSPEKDQGYFCEGMAEEIINVLANVEGLQVTSRTSAFQFKDSALDSREIGRRLHVGTLLEGSVRKAGGRLRIVVQLIDAADGYHLWSERYDRDMEDVFTIQDEIARNVAQALEVRLGPGEQPGARRAPTTDVQAYDYYLRGRNFYFKFGRRDIEFALQLFTRAIELDPAYALAHAGVADCWSYLCMHTGGGEEAREQADSASRRALDLDPQLAQAHASRGQALSLGKRHEEAAQAYERAIELDPKLFEAWYFYARHCFACGDYEKAARLFEQASTVRPEDYQSPLLLGEVYGKLGRPEDARAARGRGIERAERHLKLHPEDTRALYMGANGLVAIGERERGLEWAARALEVGPRESMLLYNIACIRALAGQIEGAIDCLEEAVEAGLAVKGWIEHDTDLDPLRSHPRFQALMQRLQSVGAF